jgi:protein O-GlcNAc transferase
MEPVIAAHDRGGFEVFCYSDVRRPDATRRIEAAADIWRTTADLSDAGLAAAIRHDHSDILVELIPRRQYLWRYNHADIALDTFPYNGHTTTLDGLWMGVPAVTLAADTHVSREGLAVLKLLGLPDLIARTPEAYVDAALRLAQDKPRLRVLRAELRASMSASPLTDAGRLTRELEAAFRRAWKAWCGSAGQADG